MSIDEHLTGCERSRKADPPPSPRRTSVPAVLTPGPIAHRQDLGPGGPNPRPPEPTARTSVPAVPIPEPQSPPPGPRSRRSPSHTSPSPPPGPRSWRCPSQTPRAHCQDLGPGGPHIRPTPPAVVLVSQNTRTQFMFIGDLFSLFSNSCCLRREKKRR